MNPKTNDLKAIADILSNTRQVLKNQGINALLIRSTDRYFNEYVPKFMSMRAMMSGFDGSVGDAIITDTSAHLFVDGRYDLQAKRQAPAFVTHTLGQAQSIEMGWLSELSSIIGHGQVLAYDPSTIDMRLFNRMTARAADLGIVLKPDGGQILHRVLNGMLGEDHLGRTPVHLIPKEISGLTPTEKIGLMAQKLSLVKADAFLSVKLDDIAWVTNLRSYCFPFQSSVPGMACISKDKILLGLAKGVVIDTPSMDEHVVIHREDELFQAIKDNLGQGVAVLAVDEGETSKAHEQALHGLNVEIKAVDNPISALKAIKNEKELLHMRSAFQRADEAVYQTQSYVVSCFKENKPLTESDIDAQIKARFTRSGAAGLSFNPICASGKNGAIIHYGTPDGEKIIEEGSLFLLDTGAYYEGGYATDLTRTFLAAGPNHEAKSWQKEMFTLVLKASITGMSARLRRGSLGMQLDAMVRAPLWQRGLDFAHGTGHGVGINVHEFPPRIAPKSMTPLMEHQVFSIEPGLYFEDLGGVRIENLVTLVADEHPDFIRVLPLTFCPLDERLIEDAMLDDHERSFLTYYRSQWEGNVSWPELPPAPRASFRH